MKGKGITKVLLLTMSLVLALSALASCSASQEEFETLKENVGEIESQVNSNTDKLETLETKEVVAELKALAESIKNTADAAATQTALAEAITKLEAADGTNAASIKAALDEVKEALEASLKANGDADAATKTAIEAALSAVKETADAAATAVAVEEIKSALEAADKAGAEAATKALADAKAALEAAIKANSDADAAVKAEIEAALAALKTADETNAQAIADALEEAIGKLEAADIDLAYNAKLEIGEVKTLLEQKVEELKAIDAANKTAIEETVATTKTALEEAIKANGEADASVKAEIEAALDVLRETDITNAQTAADALAEQVAALKNADTAVAEAAASALAEAVEALKVADAADKAELKGLVESTKTALEASISENAEAIKKTNEALDAAKAALEAADKKVAEDAAKALADAVKKLEEADTALGGRIDDVVSSLSTARTELTEKIVEVNSALKALIDTNAGKIGENANAIESLKTLVNAAATQTALNNAIETLNSTIGSNKTSAENALTTAKSELNTTINNLKTNGVDANAAAIEALQDAVAALDDTYATDTALTSAINSAIGTLEGEATTVAAAIANSKAAIEDDYNDKIAAINNETTGIKAVVTAAYTAADESLKSALDTLQSSHSTLSDKVTAIENALGNYATSEETATIAGEITWIKSELERIGADIDVTVQEFVEGFDLVTKVLQGTATLTLSNFKDDDDLEKEGALTAEEKYAAYVQYVCTLERFTNMVNEIKAREAWYRVEENVSRQYDAFIDTVETVRFYLTRATSVDSLVKYFIDFNNAYDALPTPAESLENAVKVIEDNKSITNDPACYAVAYTIMQEIDKINSDTLEDGELNTANDIVLDEALKERYDNIVAAYDNLVAAYGYANNTVAPAINAIDAVITWTDECKAEVTAAGEAYETLEGYFTEDYTKYYTDITAQSVLESSTAAKLETLTKAEARVAELDEAQSKVEGLKADEEVYAQSQVAQPLYTYLAGIEDLYESVEEWMNTYSLEEENVEIMLGKGVYNNINAALAYATAVDEINTLHDGNDVLEDAIVALNSKKPVVYTDKELAADLREKLNALKNALNGDDANLDAIIGLDNIADFKAVEEQMAILDTANTNIAKILVKMDALKVDFFKAQTMEQYKDDVLTECQIAGIAYEVASEGTPSHTGDANFNTIALAAIAKYDLWMSEYNGLVAEVVAVYNEIKDIIAETSVSLADGNAVLDADTKLYNIKIAYNLGDAKNVYLPVDGGIYLSDLVEMVAQFLKDYRTIAIDAAMDAEHVNDLIEDLPDNATKLNNYIQIKTAYDAYIAWAEKHLKDDDIANVQDIVNDAYDTGEFYKFVTIDNYNKLMPLWNTADETYDAASDAFAEVAEKLDVVDTATIYSANDFAEAFEAYKSYIERYYVDGIITNAGTNGNDGFFGEKDQKADLDADYIAYHEKLQTLETNAAEVLSMYATLYSIYGDADTTGAKLGQNLNYHEEVKAINNALDAWFSSTAYGLDEGRLTELEGIYKKDSTTDTYALVTAAKAEYIRTAYATMYDYYNGNSDKGIVGVTVSADALEVLYADLSAWDIHDAKNFTHALEEFRKHIDLYYDGNVTVNSGVGIDGEVTAYNAFLEVKKEFGAMLEAAQADMDIINMMLDSLTLDDITIDTIATYTAVTDLKTAISNYETAYNCDLNECTVCGGISAEDQLNIAKADVKAQYVAIYAAELQAVDGDVYKTADLNAALIKSNKYLDTVVVGGTTTADGALANAQSELDAVKAAW